MLCSRNRLFHDILAQRQEVRISGITQTTIELENNDTDSFSFWAIAIGTETTDIGERLISEAYISTPC